MHCCAYVFVLLPQAVWVYRTFSTMTELKTLQLKRKARRGNREKTDWAIPPSPDLIGPWLCCQAPRVKSKALLCHSWILGILLLTVSVKVTVREVCQCHCKVRSVRVSELLLSEAGLRFCLSATGSGGGGILIFSVQLWIGYVDRISVLKSKIIILFPCYFSLLVKGACEYMQRFLRTKGHFTVLCSVLF